MAYRLIKFAFEFAELNTRRDKIRNLTVFIRG